MVHTADASAGSVTVSCGFVNSDARRRRSERNIQGRMQGDDTLSSTAALIFRKFIARYADNFSMKRRSRGQQFKSALVHAIYLGPRTIASDSPQRFTRRTRNFVSTLDDLPNAQNY